jgi:hypothetical protein
MFGDCNCYSRKTYKPLVIKNKFENHIVIQCSGCKTIYSLAEHNRNIIKQPCTTCGNKLRIVSYSSIMNNTNKK